MMSRSLGRPGITIYGRRGVLHFVSLFTNVNNVHYKLRLTTGRGKLGPMYIFASRVGPCTIGILRRGRPNRAVANSVAGISAGGVPSFSVLYTNFPYRTFDSTNGERNFTSAQKAVFFRIRHVLGSGHPGNFVLRGIRKLMGRSKNGALRMVMSELATLGCGFSFHMLGSGCFKIPRRQGEVCVINDVGSGPGLSGFPVARDGLKSVLRAKLPATSAPFAEILLGRFAVRRLCKGSVGSGENNGAGVRD